MHSKYSKEQCKTVGKLIIFLDQPLGRGPNGIVHDGRNENVIPVAVKSVKKTKDNGPFIKQLRSLYRVLKKVGGSDETVSYVTMEEDVRTIYIATQRCGIDSSKVLKNGGFKNKRKIIKALCKAIKFLHLRGIVHGKLHPGNVRFDEKIAKLVDFGVNNLVPGTHVKWMSPEQRKADKSSYEATAADDIFSLAILIYYIYTNGKHLFGDPSTQEENIRKNNPKFTGCNDWELKHLILAMITKNPKKRPNINQVLKHPFFWSNEFRLHFVKDVVKHIKKQKFKKTKKDIDSRLNLVSNGRWHKELGPEWNVFLKKENKRHKCESTFSGLLYFIRNKSEHDEWEREIELFTLLSNDKHPQQTVDANSYMRFFMQKFPTLILVLATTKYVKRLPLNKKFVLPSRYVFGDVSKLIL